ncbi:alpha-ketoglutarate-dependent dioxygenase AlkB [Pseudonocardia xinjiangensis]|uniref:Alpha-ketoglutarate-dependent dioxygenase AlkB n=1 Tax=Pseudonocardia xinjiangensis TaxID=75289 RepID=A0ABX1RB47_9PSEU|nr:alpha-ketoglutarate-dependent dioxygenase AlkB [Pseudonocardia xinjiangensis]NMH77610.1 alpha-ketoglutarate-dependent dioxygenase AlkB [Pseudonocardia xinjiangensis]
MPPFDLAWQPSLLDAAADGVEIDAAFSGVRRRELGEGAWVDHGPGWCRGADGLFARLLDTTPWAGREVRMYDRIVPEPRLTHRWRLDHGPVPPAELGEMARVLSERYGVAFTQVGVNLYRDGADSVAWHGDRVARDLPEAIVALVSLGAVRPFRLRPTGGGASIGYLPGPGDLLVMGGSCQRTWQHSVPKTRLVGPRISIQFRHAYQR